MVGPNYFEFAFKFCPILRKGFDATFIDQSYLTVLVQGCRSDNECVNSEACINGKCGSPCRCGINAVCDVLNHRASCKCLPGYTGNPKNGCEPPTNPCIPNPCGINAMCEIDNGNPICFCPKGLTGNPFKNCSKYTLL